MLNHEYYMQLALELASRTKGQTSPNPVVGAVIVKNNTVIATGVHLLSGEDHAETQALSIAKEKAQDAILYVTLEPCCHTDKLTSPCVSHIIKSKIKEVVIATYDPNPKVSGMGVKRLQNAGIKVTLHVLEKEAIALNRPFFHFIKTNLPYVTLKVGMSLDGKIATATHQSKWITNENARTDAMYYRHTHDAILVGINTVITDNPSLTTRIEGGGRSPIRIVLDSTLKIPYDAKVIQDKLAPTWIITTSGANLDKINELEKLGIKIIQLPHPKIEVKSLLQELGLRQITSILVEGGAQIHQSFLSNKLVNQLVAYISPRLIGGENGFFKSMGFNTLEDTFNGQFTEVTHLNDNLKVVVNFDLNIN